jgi:NADPH:quinone reductase-like Zn-dependent oxidoreductase
MWLYEIVTGGDGRRALARRDDAALPEPAPNEVLVRIHASSLNYRDLGVLAGKYPGPLLERLVPLSDGAGEIVRVGSQVKSLKPGDKVAGCFFQNWGDGELTPAQATAQLGGSRHGMLRELAVLPEEGVVLLPPGMSYEAAATLPCAALTAWNALVEGGTFRAGHVVLLLGTGGVSIFALQMAKAMGATVIITSSSDEKLARAKTLGADHVVNYRTHPDWHKEVRRLTGGAGAHHVVEVGGAGTLSRSLASARLGGHVSVIGVLSGGKSEVDIAPFIFSALTVRGIYVGNRRMFEELLAAVTRLGIAPVIDKVFPASDAPAAYAHLRSGQHFGKIVLEH